MNRFHELTDVVTDTRFDRSTNLARLQGWRGDDLTAAVNTKRFGHRLGPAICGVGALAVAATGSMVLLVAILATAIVGVFAPNHPAETVYNAIARRTGGQPLPANRASKRLGCAAGTAFLGAAAIATALGYTTVSTVLLISLGSLALFVATTGICVPSMMFTLMFGAQQATAPRLIGRCPITSASPFVSA
jgi:hypothetical protein